VTRHTLFFGAGLGCRGQRRVAGGHCGAPPAGNGTAAHILAEEIRTLEYDKLSPSTPCSNPLWT
jgi:hypothetical protein